MESEETGSGGHLPLVAGFDIDAVIGRGGFATVYRARQPQLSRLVALKILHVDDRSDPGLVRRFDRESQTIGMLSGQPHVVTLYEVGRTTAGEPYLALEYLPNGSLQHRLVAGGPLPWPEVVQVALAVGDGLRAAHGLGIFHRDVKPANILVAGDDYKLGDFGIAGLGRGATQTAGATASTVSFAAPEVLGGRHVGDASDMYSLGATLYALLTGRPAFSRAADDSLLPMMLRVIDDPLPPLAAELAPAGLLGEIAELMSKDPGARPTAARLLKGPIAALRSGAPIETTMMRQPSEGWVDADENDMTIRRVTVAPPREVVGGGATVLRVSTVQPTLLRVPRADDVHVLEKPADAQVVADTPPATTEEPPGDGKPDSARARRRSGTRVILLAAILLLLALIIGAGLLLGGSASAPKALSVAWTRTVKGTPNGVVTVGSLTWTGIADSGGGKGKLAAFHASGLPAGQVSLPFAPGALVRDGSNIWTSSSFGEIVEVDTTRQRVVLTHDHVGNFGDLLVAKGRLWLSGYKGGGLLSFVLQGSTLSPTPSVTQVCKNAQGLAWGFNAVWVACPSQGEIVRVDPSDYQTTDIAVGGRPIDVVCGFHHVWVSDNKGQLIEIDPDNPSRRTTRPIGGSPWWLSIGSGHVFVSLGSGGVVAVDPTGRQVLHADLPPGESVGVAAAGSGEAVVTDKQNGQVIGLTLH